MSFPSNLFLFKCNIIIIYNNMILNVHDEIFWMEARQSDCLWKGHAEKKRRRGLAYQKKAWSIELYDESFNFFILNVIIGQLTNNWFVSGHFTYTCMNLYVMKDSVIMNAIFMIVIKLKSSFLKPILTYFIPINWSMLIGLT